MTSEENPERIRLLLVDDLVLLRESLSCFLASEPDLDVVAQSSSAAQALDLVRREPIDVIVIDHRLMSRGEKRFIPAARSSGCEGKVLVMADPSDLEGSLGVLQEGAGGIFPKDNPPESLAKAIRLVAGGYAWLDRRVVRMLTDRVSHNPAGSFRLPLSSREQQVLRGLCEGLTNRAIAQSLEVSEGTIKATLRRLYRRVQVQNRSQLIRVALTGSSEE